MDGAEGIVALMIPLFGIVFAIGLPLSIPIVYLVLGYRRRKRMMELHHVERMAAIERGMEIPPLPADSTPTRSPQTGLLRGLICLFIGAGLLGSWLLTGDDDMTLAGLVVGGIGVAYLVYYALEGRKLAQQAVKDTAVQRQAELR
jgi:hypothetical protein